MAPYPDEDEFWKCAKHPSKRRRTGICHLCLRDRLMNLCPNCATVRPCACFARTSSSSFALFPSFTRAESAPVSDLNTQSEPAFHRSRSVENHLLRSRFAGDPISNNVPKSGGSRRNLSFLSVFRNKEKTDQEMDAMMTRSRSLYIPTTSTDNSSKSSSEKSKAWYFPSPMKVFRHSKTSKVVQERSPLHIAGNSLPL